MRSGRARQGWIVAATALPLVILTIDFFGIVVALPTIGRELNANTTDLQWVLNAFLLAFAAPLAAVGRLGDIFGRRRLLLIGLGVFAVASALGGTAQNEWWLIGARAIQGLGTSMFFVSSLSIVSTAFPEKERGVAIGVWTAVGSIGQSLGPLVGGALTQGISWRWFFFVNIPIAVGAIVLTLWVVDESRDETAPRDIDWLGFATVTAGFVLIVLGIQLSDAAGWTAPTVVGALAAGVLALVLFAQIERRVRNPLIELGLFQGREFLGAVTVGALMAWGFAAVMFFPSLYLQHILDLTPVQTGLVFLTYTIPFAGLSPLAGRAMGILGVRSCLALGMALMSASFAILAFVGPSQGLPLVLAGLAVCAVGATLAYNVSTAAAQNAIPDEKAGAASGVQNTVRQLGTVFGVAVTGALFKALEHAKLVDLLRQAGAGRVSEADVVGLLSGSEAAQAKLATLAPVEAERIEAIANGAFAYAFGGAMLLCLALSVLGVAAAFLVRSGPAVAETPRA